MKEKERTENHRSIEFASLYFDLAPLHPLWILSFLFLELEAVHHKYSLGARKRANKRERDRNSIEKREDGRCSGSRRRRLHLHLRCRCCCHCHYLRSSPTACCFSPSSDQRPHARRPRRLHVPRHRPLQGLEQRTGGCFGAVVVDSVTKKVLGEGQNRVLETKDPTAHGEITCLREACAKLGSPHLPPGAVLYSSAEPCPMCHAACLWARCRFVFYAAKYEDVMELGRFDDVDFAAEIARRVEEKKREREGEGEEKGRSNEAAREKPLPPPTKPLLEIAPPLLREEALVVWREYAARSDNEHY